MYIRIRYLPNTVSFEEKSIVITHKNTHKNHLFSIGRHFVGHFEYFLMPSTAKNIGIIFSSFILSNLP